MPVKVWVKGNDAFAVGVALKKLKKMCEQSGLNKEIKKHEYFESKSQKERRKLRKAIKRAQMLEAERRELGN